MIKEYLSRIKTGNYLPQILNSKETVYVYTAENHVSELNELGIKDSMYLKIITHFTKNNPGLVKPESCYIFSKSAAERRSLERLIEKPIEKKEGLFLLLSIPRKKDLVKHNLKDIAELKESFSGDEYFFFLRILYAFDQGDSSFLFKNISKIENMYLETEAQPVFGDIMISAGVSSSNEIIRFLRKIGHSGFLYGFEPNENYYKDLISLKLEAKNYLVKKIALSSEGKSFTKFDNSGISSKLSSGGKSEVPTTTIDLYLNEEKVNLIKLNTNGNELDILKGSVSTLKNQKPKLMINLSLENLISLPRFLKNFDYKFKVRYYDKSNLLNNIILYCY